MSAWMRHIVAMILLVGIGQATRASVPALSDDDAAVGKNRPGVGKGAEERAGRTSQVVKAPQNMTPADADVKTTRLRLATWERDKFGGPPRSALPAGAAAELDRVDATYQAALEVRPVDQWRFDDARSGYEAIGKRWADSEPVKEAIRSRLEHLARHEQAAAAAREIRDILARSHRRDRDLAELKRRLAALDQVHNRTYHAIGTIRPSSRTVDGRKLFTLVTADGQTAAYLDLPPGLDAEALGKGRYGVRGAVHFNQDLGTRLITVREVEPVSTRR